MKKNSFGATTKRDGHIQMMKKNQRTSLCMNELYASVMLDIRNFGSKVNDTIEICNASYTLEDPTLLNIDDIDRKWKSEYAVAEFLFYLGQSPKVGKMGKLASIWDQIKDDNGEIESNYGCYIFGDPWYQTTDELIINPDSRRAVIPIFNVKHYENNLKDYPCTGFIQFLVRDHKLHLIWNMRSCDAIFGLCNDMFCASMFQQLMLNHIREQMNNLQLGTLTFNLGSLHIYERHWGLLFSYLEMSDYNGERWELRPKSIYNDNFVKTYGYKPTDTIAEMKRKKDLFINDNIRGAIL